MPLFEHVDNPIVVDGDPELIAEAQRRIGPVSVCASKSMRPHTSPTFNGALCLILLLSMITVQTSLLMSKNYG